MSAIAIKDNPNSKRYLQNGSAFTRCSYELRGSKLIVVDKLLPTKNKGIKFIRRSFLATTSQANLVKDFHMPWTSKENVRSLSGTDLSKTSVTEEPSPAFIRRLSTSSLPIQSIKIKQTLKDCSVILQCPPNSLSVTCDSRKTKSETVALKEDLDGIVSTDSTQRVESISCSQRRLPTRVMVRSNVPTTVKISDSTSTNHTFAHVEELSSETCSTGKATDFPTPTTTTEQSDQSLQDICKSTSTREYSFTPRSKQRQYSFTSPPVQTPPAKKPPPRPVGNKGKKRENDQTMEKQNQCGKWPFRRSGSLISWKPRLQNPSRCRLSPFLHGNTRGQDLNRDYNQEAKKLRNQTMPSRFTSHSQRSYSPRQESIKGNNSQKVFKKNQFRRQSPKHKVGSSPLSGCGSSISKDSLSPQTGSYHNLQHSRSRSCPQSFMKSYPIFSERGNVNKKGQDNNQTRELLLQKLDSVKKLLQSIADDETSILIGHIKPRNREMTNDGGYGASSSSSTTMGPSFRSEWDPQLPQTINEAQKYLLKDTTSIAGNTTSKKSQDMWHHPKFQAFCQRIQSAMHKEQTRPSPPVPRQRTKKPLPKRRRSLYSPLQAQINAAILKLKARPFQQKSLIRASSPSCPDQSKRPFNRTITPIIIESEPLGHPRCSSRQGRPVSRQDTQQKLLQITPPKSMQNRQSSRTPSPSPKMKRSETPNLTGRNWSKFKAIRKNRSPYSRPLSPGILRSSCEKTCPPRRAHSVPPFIRLDPGEFPPKNLVMARYSKTAQTLCSLPSQYSTEPAETPNSAKFENSLSLISTILKDPHGNVSKRIVCHGTSNLARTPLYTRQRHFEVSQNVWEWHVFVMFCAITVVTSLGLAFYMTKEIITAKDINF